MELRSVIFCNCISIYTILAGRNDDLNQACIVYRESFLVWLHSSSFLNTSHVALGDFIHDLHNHQEPHQ